MTRLSRGGNGPVQVTLRWNTHEDLDLHLGEPGDAGACEIFCGDTNDPDSGTGSSCGAMGILDLDSEAGCLTPPDYVDIENIIYPPASPAPSGTYTVRVDHYQNCTTSLTSVPTDLDWSAGGSAGGGRQVMTFVVP